VEKRVEEQCGFLVQAAYVAVLAGIAYLCARYLLAWLFPLAAGYLIAMLARPASVFVADRLSISQRAAGRAVLLALYLLLAALLALFGTLAVGYLQQAAAALPIWYRQVLRPATEAGEALLKEWLGRVLPGVASRLSLESLLADIQRWVVTSSAELVGRLGSLTARLPGYLMTFLFTIASSLLISGEYQDLTGFVARQAPKPVRRILSKVREGAGAAVLGYCKAYALLLCATFLELAAGLWLLGVESAVPIALLATVLDLLPILGVGTLLLPWALLQLLQGSHAMAAGLVLLYAVVLVVHNLLEPRLIGRQLGLHPLVSLCAVYLGFRVFGIAGMILAPIAAQLVIGLHQSGAVRLWR